MAFPSIGNIRIIVNVTNSKRPIVSGISSEKPIWNWVSGIAAKSTKPGGNVNQSDLGVILPDSHQNTSKRKDFIPFKVIKKTGVQNLHARCLY